MTTEYKCRATVSIDDSELGDKQYQGPEYPIFTDKHKSFMRKHLTKELFEQLKDKKTASGVTIYHVIKPGVDSPHLNTGCVAGDEESWVTFKDLFNRVISTWHKGYNPETQKHVSDLNPKKVKLSEEQIKKFNEVVVSTRIRAARSLRGHCLPCLTTKEDRNAVEAKLKDILEKHFDGELKGTYYPLTGLSPENEEMLRSNGFLFQKPSTRNVLTNAGGARDWPEGRGIFHNEDHTCLAWVNEEDHCRIISMAKGGDIKAVFARFCKMSDTFGKHADIMHNDTHGFLGTCPSNLGTGMRASVMVKLEQFNKDVHLLEEACDQLDLQPRGSGGEYSAAVGAKWDISNKQRIGYSEVQLVQKLIDGLWQLLAWEERLLDTVDKPEEKAILKDEIQNHKSNKGCGAILTSFGMDDESVSKVRKMIEEKAGKLDPEKREKKRLEAQKWEDVVLKINKVSQQVDKVHEILTKKGEERGINIYALTPEDKKKLIEMVGKLFGPGPLTTPDSVRALFKGITGYALHQIVPKSTNETEEMEVGK